MSRIISRVVRRWLIVIARAFAPVIATAFVASLAVVFVTASFGMTVSLARADEFRAIAKVDVAQSRLMDARRGGVSLTLALSQGVPWRIFQLDSPRRVVLDFQEIDWTGLTAEGLGQAKPVKNVRFGVFRPGWSRMVFLLDAPLALDTAGLTIDNTTGQALLAIHWVATKPEAFAKASGAPHDPRWDLPAPAETKDLRENRPDWAPTIVVLDPGHGGIDPGAENQGLQEKTLMLEFAREIRDLLRRAGGFEVVMTRKDDTFVSLERRVSLAHQAGADVFVSLHADSLHKGNASGATVYVLADNASDAASAQLAERHDRADILAGLDLSGADDEVTDVLLDLARLETQPRTRLLAHAIVAGVKASGGTLNRKPLRKAGFSVLKAADVPSVLIEVGFLSSKTDLSNLRDPNWRALMAGGIRDGLQAWVIADKAARDLVRQ